MRDWVEHAVFWHVYPLGFVGAEREAIAAAPVAHRLGHLIDWLDYAVNMGASGLLLGPIFASSTHGYDTTDHFRIDPRLGNDTDFNALMEAAHTRGLRVVLDGVFNHVGRALVCNDLETVFALNRQNIADAVQQRGDFLIRPRTL